MAPKTFYVLECNVQSCTAEFYLNDIPVVRRGSDIGVQWGGQVNQYIKDGVNELTIVVGPGPVPSESLVGPGGQRSRCSVLDCEAEALPNPDASEDTFDVDPPDLAEAKAVLGSYPYGAVVGGPDRKVLAEVTWEGGTAEATLYPRVVTGRVDLGGVVGRWAWQDLPQLDGIDDTVRDEIHAFLAELRTGFGEGDPEPFIEHSALRLDEVCRAYSSSQTKRINLIRKITVRDYGHPAFAMAPIERSDYSLRLCCEGRLVECMAKDWKPLLRERPRGKEGMASYSMLLGRVEGNWHIFR